MKKTLDDIACKKANELDTKIRQLIRNGQDTFGKEKLAYQARATTYARKYLSITGRDWRI